MTERSVGHAFLRLVQEILRRGWPVNWRNFETSVRFISRDFFSPFQIPISEFFSPLIISGCQVKSLPLDTRSAMAMQEIRKSKWLSKALGLKTKNPHRRNIGCSRKIFLQKSFRFPPLEQNARIGRLDFFNRLSRIGKLSF